MMLKMTLCFILAKNFSTQLTGIVIVVEIKVFKN